MSCDASDTYRYSVTVTVGKHRDRGGGFWWQASVAGLSVGYGGANTYEAAFVAGHRAASEWFLRRVAGIGADYAADRC